HGNFGSIDGDPAAAYRYTESRMSRMATKMLTDIDKDTVDFMSNYDDRLKEPVVLPSKYPNLLVNGSVGIAVGMATNIPPHNLRETVEAACCLIDNPDATLDDLMEHIKGPDFPTGGIIMGRAGIRAAYATGRAKLIVRSKTEIQEWKNDRYRIVVTEIPYMVNKARLIESIADLVKEKRIEGISDLRDESDREGMRIVIELKRDANAQVVLNQLYTYTQLQDTCGVIMLALVNGVPKILPLKEVLQNYIDFQREVITRRTRFELGKLREREHILEGLKIAQDNIDEVIHIIRTGKDDNENRPRLMERFGLSEIQANAILQMRLGRLSALNREAMENELAEIRTQIKHLEEVLGDMHLVDGIIKTEMREIAEKFGDDRRTGIETISGEMDLEDLIPVEDRVITLTHFGYIKSQPVDAYKAQRRGGRGISGMTRRDEDYVESLFTVSTHDYILFFTDKGKVFRIKGYEIPESQRAARGTNIVNVLPLEQDEKVTTLIKLEGITDEDGTYLTMVTKNGVIKRTRLSQYRNVRKSGLNAISLDEGDELKWVRLTGGEDELIVATRKGFAIHFKETDARELGRTARGVRAIELREGDEVVGMEIVEEGKKLLTISEGGKGRRSEFSDYSIQNRGGKGIQNYKTDNVAGIKAVSDDDDIIAISSDGIIIRLSVDEVNVQFRSASGVKVMRLASEDSRVVSFTVAPKGEDEDEAEGEETAEAPSEEAPAEEVSE
ncbi:MAG: DNA gyrase subunit A, partial [Oscillospiraceae bacterium]|nr:DNA gyrase subunit A [Oscillospiraceae bacterium]